MRLTENDIKLFMEMFPTCPSPTLYPNTVLFYTKMYLMHKEVLGSKG